MIFRLAFLIFLFVSIPFSAYEAGAISKGKIVTRTTKYMISNTLFMIIMFFLAYFFWDA